MEFEQVLIYDKRQLVQYAEKIFELFEKCFNKKISEDLWRWAYIDNPNGDPIVSLYFYEDILVGHYAAIPMSLLYKGEVVCSLLSMTTMVHSSYRRYGLFVRQAMEVYDKAIGLGYDLIYGFPNKNSAPGFVKRLGWDILQGYIIQLDKRHLLKLYQQHTDNMLKFNIRNESSLRWRLSKPNQEYLKIGTNILKSFGTAFDIIYHENNFSSLEDREKYNIFIVDEIADCADDVGINYIFGYKLFNDKFKDKNFKIDLILSDVF